MNHQDLLVEIGVEELPASASQPMSQALAAGLEKALQNGEFLSETSGVEVYSTPRRIAVLLAGVASAQADRAVERKGPSVATGFDQQGEPTKALAGFARSCGVDVDTLERVETDKGEWFVFRSMSKGLPLADFLSAELPAVIKQIPSPRRMRWSDGETEFLRPVRWLTVLHGDEHINLELLGCTSGRVTYGHRFHYPDAIDPGSAANYASVLSTNGHVMPDFDSRRMHIAEEVEQCAQSVGARVDINDELLDEVTALVEWPVAIAGSFDPEFLSLPKEALVQTMAENQRYFALYHEDGGLYPGFITVANLISSNQGTIREGNERVIRPRFADTLFFWQKDREQKLEQRLESLEKVLFQKDLGSLRDRTRRLKQIAQWLALELDVDSGAAARAAELSKCDLVTDTVGELAKMQGIAGSYLAESDGENAQVCSAIREQYLPLKSGGDLPATPIGQVLSIADKADILVGIFGIGQKPSGAKDPFALRRAAVGMLRILIEGNLPLNIEALFQQTARIYGGDIEKNFDSAELLEFVQERLRNYYLERGERHDVIDAVAAKGITDPYDFNRRVTAIAGFRRSDAAESLAAANKRINNILKKAGSDFSVPVRDEYLIEPAEKTLAGQLAQIEAELSPQFEQGNYGEAMQSTAKLRESVDDFFDHVMVMDEDENLRSNRLALLNRVAGLCSRTADLSKLQPEN